MLTALCNIFINTEEKLALFKETLPRVFPVSDNWLIYIRGKLRNEATAYVRDISKNHPDDCVFFNNLDDAYWAKNTLLMLKKAKYSTVFIFVEDHMLLHDLVRLKKVIMDMNNEKIDYFCYSFFNQGLNVNMIEAAEPSQSEYFYSFDITKNAIGTFRNRFPDAYLFSLPCFVSLRYFQALLEFEKIFQLHLPILFQGALSRVFGFHSPYNRLVYSKINAFLRFINLRLVIYNKNTPFNTERSVLELEKHVLPIKIGILKNELFCCVEDDNMIPGSSLIKRGLYPLTLKRNRSDCRGTESGKWLRFSLAPGEKQSFCFYPDTQRVNPIPQKTIFVIAGDLTVSNSNECYQLQQGEQINLAANIPYAIFTKTGCDYKSILV